jgi:c-di-GMP-binding flagellar brake protein YcgR
MEGHLNKSGERPLLVRDRRYAIRHPFAADASFLDLEMGVSAEGVTSDLSMGGCFVCTNKPLAISCRMRLTLERKDEKVEALAVVRIFRARVGMGVEFLDVDPKHQPTLERWLERLRRVR